MELNKGDEILIKAKVKFADECGGMVLAETDSREFYVNAANIVSCGEDTLEGKMYAAGKEAGMDAAWSLAAKIVLPESDGGYGLREQSEIFGGGCSPFNIFKNCTAREAMEAVKSWEDEKAREAREIHVGDVVVYKGGSGNKAVVMEKVHKDAGVCCRLLWQDGSYGGVFYDTDLEKTGRHIDIEALLNQIGGDE